MTLEFASYSVDEIAQIVRNLAAADGLTLEPEAARLIAGQCNGTPGNAGAILRRIRAHYGRLVTGAPVDEELARRLLTLLGHGDDETGTVALADRLRLMSGTQFEEFVASLFRNLGYVTQLTPGSGDHGVDILIRKAGQLGAVQCKRWTDAVGEPVIRDFLGSMLSASATVGYVAATTTFTDQARAFAHKHSIQLLDLDALLRMASADTRRSSQRSLF